HTGRREPAAVGAPLARADPRAPARRRRGGGRPADAAGVPHLRPPRGRRRARGRVPRHARDARADAAGAAVIPGETLLWLYRTMLTIRIFERRVAREFRTGEIPGFVHMHVGEESIAAGV